MFYLWVGVMAGILLAYLAMRARSRGETGDLATRAGRRRQRQLKPWWRSWLWLLGGVVALLLLIPVIWEFIRTGFVSFGWVEAIKTILIPWFAGVGFGIWIYLTIGSLPDDVRGLRRSVWMVGTAAKAQFRRQRP
jgi:ABC-type Fe3+ transport system permease subunit